MVIDFSKVSSSNEVNTEEENLEILFKRLAVLSLKLHILILENNIE